MIYKRFYHIIIFRIIFIVVTCMAFSWFLLASPLKIYTLIVISSALIIHVVLLIKYVNGTNRQLAGFFTALKDDQAYYKITDAFARSSGHELSQILNETSSLLKNARIEKEKQYRFMQFIFEAAPTGMIIYQPDGKIIQTNPAVKALLKIEKINDLSDLTRVNKLLESKIRAIHPGGHELVRIPCENDFLVLMISIAAFKIGKSTYNLATIQDFRNEMEASEIESWQKLIRVINHEIMNSITPIITLTEASRRILVRDAELIDPAELNKEYLEDMLLNTDLIAERSKGLKSFIENYRNVSKIRVLKMESVSIKMLVNNTLLLLNEAIDKPGINVIISVEPEDLSVDADEELLMQVMINLVRNAIFALSATTQALIRINSKTDSSGRVSISIADNGCGIPKEIMNEIFIPFYSTRDDGAGIGLSLSRHIMRLHRGSIAVSSESGERTEFVLRF